MVGDNDRRKNRGHHQFQGSRLREKPGAFPGQPGERLPVGPRDYLSGLKKQAHQYNGFNLIVGRTDELYWYSNRGGQSRSLSPGIYGVSNSLLDTPWPKVTQGKLAMKRLLSEGKDQRPDALFHILLDRSIPDDKSLPDTGVGLDWERILSPIFILSPTYGTRSSTILSIDHSDQATFIERTFDSDPDHATTVSYGFQVGS